MSYLARHRTICDTLIELRAKLKDEEHRKLIDEAIGYARSMNAKLTLYKVHGLDQLLQECVVASEPRSRTES